ncbi:MAG: hypothetical protein PHQ52_04920 [Candidatus Omnitrophica bacterium]|jgi:hypothetical protein|nr:hypothetical protein [Candidatus Omnitrophota bacterium]
MKINFRYIKEKDIFELQVVEPQLRAHFILKRNELNKLRVAIERVLVDSTKKKPDAF